MNAIVEMRHLKAGDIRDTMVRSLKAAALDAAIPGVDRMLELIAGAPGATRDDARLLHLIDMFGVLNACGINENIAPDQAHDPLNKDSRLKERYASMRLAAG